MGGLLKGAEQKARRTRPAFRGEVLDLRFRALLGTEAWERLPPAVQARFSKRMAPGRSVTYAGEVQSCRFSVPGWLLSQACRLIGAPLPLGSDCGVAAVVTVTEDAASGGQVWTRMYARKAGLPQVIHSVKRFAGPTGLEELLGGGFGIALTVEADAHGIRFVSDHYFVCLWGLHLRLPKSISPGTLRIDHRDLGAGAFAFVLDLRHPVFGVLVAQHNRFNDPLPNERTAP